MEIKAPDPAWLPLRRAALAFHRSELRPDLSSADLVQRLADLAAETENLSIDYDHEDERFDISWAGSVGTISFRLGDDIARPSPDLRAEHEALNRVRRAMEELHRRLEYMVKRNVEKGLAVVHARVGSAISSDFTWLPPDVFLHFKIENWRTGAARSEETRLFSIHCSEPSSEAGAQVSATPQFIKNTATDKFARWALEKHNGQRPPGTFKEMNAAFNADTGNKLDLEPRTMKIALGRVAKAAGQESGIPMNS